MMPLFVCDECRSIDNTATGHYWTRALTQWMDASKNGKALCSACAPTEYDDGSKNPEGGKWHGRFPREVATAENLAPRLEHFVYTAGILPLKPRR